MSDVIDSPNMNLPVPVVSEEPGPDYANDVNNCLGILDSHNHSFGSGVQITPSGLNINADLNINSNNLTSIRSSRYASQNSVLTNLSDLNCTYVVLGDLYYNDGVGNNVRITQNGAVAGSPGSIANLTSPASASYSPGTATFIWQSDANTPANMDMGSIIIRKIVANSNGITLSAPNSLSSDYTLTLPAVLPGSTSYLTVDSSGNISVASPVNQGIDQSSMAIRATGSTVGAGGFAISSSCASFTTGVSGPVTNLSVTITTLGNPVKLQLQADGSANPSYIQCNSTTNEAFASFSFFRGATQLNIDQIDLFVQANAAVGTLRLQSVPGAFSFMDIVSAGTYTYTFQVNFVGSNVSPGATVNYLVLTAYEIK